MTSDTTGRDLELEVKDFGPISEARIDLRPLTVFVGPSNTGKSYLATLIYALHSTYGRWFGYDSLVGFGPLPDKNKISKKEFHAFVDVAQSIVENKTSGKEGQYNIVLPQPVVRALSSTIDALGFNSEIRRCFGISEMDTLIRKKGADTARVLLRRRISDVKSITHTIFLGAENLSKIEVPNDTPVQINVGLVRDDSRILHDLERTTNLLNSGLKASNLRIIYFVHELLMETFREALIPSIFAPLTKSAWYLPAGRTGIMQAHSVVVSALIANASSIGIRPSVRTPLFSGVLADFLEKLIELDRTGSRNRAADYDLGAAIERTILEGSVRLNQSSEIEYPKLAYRPHGWESDLDLSNTSSMVSELAPIVLYLRHVVQPGNVLVVEEPESHLHPAMQVELIRQLAVLVDVGIRIIITTHSEWLIEELQNIVNRSLIPKDDHGDRVALAPEMVGAWLFKPDRKSRGSMVQEVKLDDSGLYKTDFDEVSYTLHNDWADIVSQVRAVR